MPFSGPWPRSGIMLSGTVYQLPTLAPPTSEIGFGLLPTPRKCSAMVAAINNAGLPQRFPNYETVIARTFLPTLGKNEPKGSSRKRFRGSPHFRGAKMSEGLRICEADPIYLHPSFAELVMGFPIGWGVLEPAETP